MRRSWPQWEWEWADGTRPRAVCVLRESCSTAASQKAVRCEGLVHERVSTVGRPLGRGFLPFFHGRQPDQSQTPEESLSVRRMTRAQQGNAVAGSELTDGPQSTGRAGETGDCWRRRKSPEASGSRFEVQPMGGSCELRGELSTGLPSFNHGTTATARQACDAEDDPTGQPTHGLGPTETAEPAIGQRRRRIKRSGVATE